MFARKRPTPSDRPEDDDAESPKRKKTDRATKQLSFDSPGAAQSVAQEGLMDFGVRTTRSGKKIPLPTITEEIEHTDVFELREGSRVERGLHLAKQLKDRVRGFEREDEEESEAGSGASDLDDEAYAPLVATVVHAVESLEQQLEDEENSTPCSVAFLGQNGAGKSFLINLVLQVTEVRNEEYALEGVRLAGSAKDSKEATLRKYLFDTLEGSLELRKGNKFDVTEANLRIAQRPSPCAGHYIPQEEREEEERIVRKLKGVVREGAPNREDKRGFLLPSEGRGVSTTKIAVRARKVCRLVCRVRVRHVAT